MELQGLLDIRPRGARTFSLCSAHSITPRHVRFTSEQLAFGDFTFHFIPLIFMPYGLFMLRPPSRPWLHLFEYVVQCLPVAVPLDIVPVERDV